MALQVVDRRERQPPRGGEPLGGRDADEQRADQPGPLRDRDGSTSSRPASARASASSTTALTSSRWWRDAISGTTPPKRSWTPCEETTSSAPRPAAVTTAAQVSSQQVSSARIKARRRGVSARRRACPAASRACATSQRVLAVVLVVAPPHARGAEAEALVERDRRRRWSAGPRACSCASGSSTRSNSAREQRVAIPCAAGPGRPTRS